MSQALLASHSAPSGSGIYILHQFHSAFSFLEALVLVQQSYFCALCACASQPLNAMQHFPAPIAYTHIVVLRPFTAWNNTTARFNFRDRLQCDPLNAVPAGLYTSNLTCVLKCTPNTACLAECAEKCLSDNNLHLRPMPSLQQHVSPVSRPFVVSGKSGM